MSTQLHERPLEADEVTLTDDGFLDGKIRALQPAKGYRAGIDAVLLAASIPARAHEQVLEAGMGVGIASLCLASRVPEISIHGIERQPQLVKIARENATRNGMGTRLLPHEGDIGLSARDLTAQGLLPNSFHHVFANPPFYDPANASSSPDASRAQSHLTMGSDIKDWVRFACLMARAKATISFIHRADALDQLLGALQGHVGGIEIFPLWPAVGKPASRVIVRGQRDSRAPLTLRPGLVLHGREGRFTDAVENILRNGAPLLFDQPL